MSAIAIRPTCPQDAAFLVPLIDAAGEGIPAHVWGRMAAPGQPAAKVGLARLRSDTGALSWRNGGLAERNGVAAGCVFIRRLPDALPPLPAGRPPIFVPPHDLESEAPGAGYDHVLATAPTWHRAADAWRHGSAARAARA